MIWIYAIFFLLLNALWVFFNLFFLPGNWLIVLTSAGIVWHLAERSFISIWTVAAMAIFALLGEIVEMISGFAVAKASGASWVGSMATICGAGLGAILGTILIPIPFIGTIFGAGIGGGMLSAIYEKIRGKTSKKSIKIALMSGGGAVFGSLFKFFIGILLWIFGCCSIFF